MEKEKKHIMIWNISHYLSNKVEAVRACVPASGAGWLVFFPDCWQQQVAGGILKLLRFIQMLWKRTTDVASQCRWIVIQSILQKQSKTFSRQRNGILFNCQVCLDYSHLQPEGGNIWWHLWALDLKDLSLKTDLFPVYYHNHLWGLWEVGENSFFLFVN